MGHFLVEFTAFVLTSLRSKGDKVKINKGEINQSELLAVCNLFYLCCNLFDLCFLSKLAVGVVE